MTQNVILFEVATYNACTALVGDATTPYSDDIDFNVAGVC